jgi:enediyne polyketide synthase
MAATNGVAGAMASISAGRAEAEALINGDRVVVAGVNSPFQTILSGEKAALETVLARARARKLQALNLSVSHAFHSPLVAAAAVVLAQHLSGEEFKSVRRPIISTVTGSRLPIETDLRALLHRQITAPVLFMDAVARANEEGVDLWLEVGPGFVLGRLTDAMTATPVISLNAGGDSLKGLLQAVGAAFALGSEVNHAALFAGRFVRPFNLDWQPRFFANPCELAPLDDAQRTEDASAGTAGEETSVEKALAITSPASPDTSNASALELVIELVAERCELPPTAIRVDHRLLSDLHLNSITVSQLVAAAARRLNLPRPVAPTDFADASVREVAEGLEEQRRAGHTSQTESDETPPGIDSWLRPFTIELVEKPRPQRGPAVVKGTWLVLSTDAHPLADLLRQGLAECGEGKGVVVCLPPEPDERHIALLLDGARAIAEDRENARFVLVQHGGSAAAFARTLKLEMPEVITCVVDLPTDNPAAAAERIIAEALSATVYTEVYYDGAARRHEPVWRPLPATDISDEQPLTADDVLVVTGGGKGITAECALSLAKTTGARLALLGRATPESDAELSNNLARMKAAGLTFRYICVDITDERALRAAVVRIEQELGTVTAILHGAARNSPQLLAHHREELFQRTLGVKVQGARNLLAAVNPEKLRLFIAFGSIIARTGLPGEADYGLANEWLTRLAEQWQAAHPHCRCLAIEWSVWSGVGMGQRLASVDLLTHQGIVPIPPDQGISMLNELLARRLPSVSVVVAGRYRELPTFQFERAELPFLRFLERPRVYYPGIELVVDVDLSTDSDPYLNDHQLQGERLLPAVVGLEAMAQAATALSGANTQAIFEDVFFAQPVVVPQSSPLTIRIIALAREPGVVEVALRSGETAFQLDHFKATCRFQVHEPEAETVALPLALAAALDDASTAPCVPLESTRSLYGDILFHGGRFQRLNSYRLLRATECLAEIAPDDVLPWFSPYLPETLLLGNPARRDAAIHAIQACIPHATLLPTGASRISLYSTAPDAGPFFVHAKERSRTGNLFIYDMQVMTADGVVRERWDGLRLRLVNDAASGKHWAEVLLAPYVERRVQELIAGADVSVALRREACGSRTERSDSAIQAALGQSVPILRRPDGKPEASGRQVSASHCGDLTFAVAGRGALGCDIEQVLSRSDVVWRDLLGDDRFALAGLIERNSKEDAAAARTRVWTASECLKKAGGALDAPLLYVSSTADGWVLLASGQLLIATCVTQVRERDERLALSVLVEGAQPERGSDELF